MKPSNKLLKAFRLSILITLILLIAEFVLGMYTTLFIEFPDSLNNGNAWTWSFSQSPVIQSHVYVGTLLFVISLVALGLSFASKSKPGIITAVLGLVLILVSYVSGSAFLSNVQDDAYSFWMALGFIGALVTYAVGYYLTRPFNQVKA